MPVLEAMACRCPVVATRCGGPEELIENGVNGILADVDDARGLADGIVTSLSSEATWMRLSRSAYETGRSFDATKSAKEFEAVLVGALEGAS